MSKPRQPQVKFLPKLSCKSLPQDVGGVASLQRGLWSGLSVWALPHGEDVEPGFLRGTRPLLPRVSRTHTMTSGPAVPL